jgi:hypothetical protein
MDHAQHMIIVGWVISVSYLRLVETRLQHAAHVRFAQEDQNQDELGSWNATSPVDAIEDDEQVSNHNEEKAAVMDKGVAPVDGVETTNCVLVVRLEVWPVRVPLEQ